MKNTSICCTVEVKDEVAKFMRRSKKKTNSLAISLVLLTLMCFSATAQQVYQEPRSLEERWARQADPEVIAPLSPAQLEMVNAWTKSVLTFALSREFRVAEQAKALFDLDLTVSTSVGAYKGRTETKSEISAWRPNLKTIPLANNGGVRMIDWRGDPLAPQGFYPYPGAVIRLLDLSMKIDKSKMCIQDADLQRALDGGLPFTWSVRPMTYLRHHSNSRSDIERLKRRGGDISVRVGTYRLGETDDRTLSFEFLNWKCLIGVNLLVAFWK